MSEYGENGEVLYHGSDSTVTIPRDSQFITKEYHSLSVDEVSRYAQLHRILSSEFFRIELSGALRNFLGTHVQYVEISFLNIGSDISVRFGCVQHKIPHIPGDTLSDVFRAEEKMTKIFIDFLEQEIAQFVSERLGISTLFSSSINLLSILCSNIKVISCNNNILCLCVTDIGSSISRLLLENKEAIDRILQLQP